MAFTAADVKTLREMTSVGMMDCKKALVECDGDMDKAVEWLREKGLAKAAKKAGRIAAEGMSYALTENGVGVVVEAYKKLFNKEPLVIGIHAGLECVLFSEKYPHLDMVSFGPTLRGVHSPDERLLIPTVEMVWDHLLEILKNVPKK